MHDRNLRSTLCLMVKGTYNKESIPQSFVDAIKSAIERDKEEERAAKIGMQDVIKEMEEERKRDRNMRI